MHWWSWCEVEMLEARSKQHGHCGCWLQGQVYLFPGMQANTGRADGVFECPLSDHRFIIPSQKVDILSKKLPGEYQNSRLSTI